MVEVLIEIFMAIIGLGVALAIFGFLRNPQVPATIAFGGIIIFFIAVMTTSLDMGNLVQESVTTGDTTEYTYQEDIEPFTDLSKVVIALIGVILMLLGGLMVYKA